MKRAVAAAAVLVLVLGFGPLLNVADRLRPFDRPALTGEPCDTLPWGMAMAEYGPRAGRTAEQVDEVDVERPRAFFTAMRAHNRAAFDAQRAYCDALLGG